MPVSTRKRSSMVAPPKSVAALLSAGFPPLRLLWPNLQTCSPKQAAFLALPNLEAFFGGAAGPGKSDALLAGALQYADVPGYAALILRRTYSDLALPGAAMPRSKEWLTGKARWADKTYTWTFPSSATLTFGYCEAEDDVYRYQSSEFQYIGFDELTQFSEAQYEYLFSRLRGTSDIPVPLRMRAASNPGGVGHGWVKKRFITGRAPGVVFIPARLDDHPDEKFKAEYRLSLAKLGGVRRKQYEEGDWDAAGGLAFGDITASLIEPFDLPDHWDRFESMDHGTTAPTAWALYALDTDGNIVVADLYYRPNTLPDEDAAAILKRRLPVEKGGSGWERTDTAGWAVRNTCYGDPASIREKLAQRDDMGQPMTLQDLYAKQGVFVTPANNRRRTGYVAVRQALRPDPQRRFPLWHPRAGEYGAPRLFIIQSRCQELVTQLQDAPLADGENDPERGEAIDQKWERHHGHATACLRYGLATWQNPSEEPDDPEPVTPAEIREAYWARQQQHALEQTTEPETDYWGDT